jgi:hypothetical protein
MSPQNLAEQIERIIISTNSRYARNIIALQDELYESLLLILKKVEVTSEGLIKQNASNRKLLLQAQAVFTTFALSPSFHNALESHLSAIPRINRLNQQYFEVIKETFQPNRNFIKSLQKQAIETVNTQILRDGFVAQVKAPLNEILNQNVNSGGSFSGMLDQVRAFVKGGDGLDGRLISYSRGILRDALFNYSRAYQQSVTADLGLKWYSYSGGLIDDSREFCIERAGRFYHEDEIRLWASLEWQGKNRYTTESSIFWLCGGYNCVHQLIPVSDVIVPKADLDRVTGTVRMNQPG